MKAHMDRIILEGEGIPCVIFDEHMVHNVPIYDLAVGGIRLKVREEDVEKALGILSTTGHADNPGANNGIIYCPNCNSTYVKTNPNLSARLKEIISAITSLLFLTRFFPQKKLYYCKQCGEEFERESS